MARTQINGVRVTAQGRRGPPAGVKTADPVHPNAGQTAAYRRRLEALITDMHNSVTYWTKAKYRANAPEIAQDAAKWREVCRELGVDPAALDVMQFRIDGPNVISAPLGELLAMDASPAATMRSLMKKLARRWTKNFDRLAQEMADHFATDVQDRTDNAMRDAMAKAGWTVKFKPTRAANDVLQAVVGENVALIKSIPQKYLTAVEGDVMRSVATGRDLGALTKALENSYDVTHRRAAFIARDQNNKATAAYVRVRQQELGITKAVWQHSHGGKEPRPTHLANDGHVYDVGTGWYDPAEGKYVRPGELINCRCVSRSVVPGFE